METDRTAPLSEPITPAPLPFRRDGLQAGADAPGDAVASASALSPDRARAPEGAADSDEAGALAADPPQRGQPEQDGDGQPWTSTELGAAGAGGADGAVEHRPGRVRAVVRETLETVLLALLIFVSVRAVIQNFKVEGSSMEPNLHSGQYLLVNKAAYFALDLSGLGLKELLPSDGRNSPVVVYPFGAPSRGDVIVFRYPKDPRRDFIKRVIAVPGDTVEIRMGRVLVNGQMLNEPYIVENPAYSKEPQVVPPDNYYVLGDNRNNSSDSHVWGPVPREYIIGKAWLSYWPLSEWGLAPNYTVAAQDAPAAN